MSRKNKLDRMSHIWDTANTGRSWLPVVIYEPARREIVCWPAEAKKELGAVLTRLQKGESIGVPDVRPMATVAKGAAEVRVKIARGIYRAFFVIETEVGILVFHGFAKKSQKTPRPEIETGRTRLAALMKEIGR